MAKSGSYAGDTHALGWCIGVTEFRAERTPHGALIGIADAVQCDRIHAAWRHTENGEEVNYLIYRYLCESGFVHSAFTFANESLVTKSTVAQLDIPPGALITFLQKGLEYVGIEEHIAEDGTVQEFDDDYSLLSPFVCHAIARKEALPSHMKKPAAAAAAAAAAANDSYTRMEEDMPANGIADGDHKTAVTQENVAYHLQGHRSEVYYCSWSPCDDVLATGSGDATCRLWCLNNIRSEGHMKRPGETLNVTSAVLPHTHSGSGSGSDKQMDVTSLCWCSNGERVATGCYDGTGNIWDRRGTHLQKLQGHQGPVFALKFTPSGDLVVSGSYDRRSIVWNTSTGTEVRVLSGHTKPVLDVDWRDNDVCATASADTSVRIWSVRRRSLAEISAAIVDGEEISYRDLELVVAGGPSSEAVRVFQGHTDEVNVVAWSPNKQLLASCSDDCTAKIWRLDREQCLLDFREHTNEIFTTIWSPTGEGSPNPNLPLRLITGSFDSTVKLWDVDHGTCTNTLSKDKQPLYGVACNPSGDLLASGSLGGFLNVWSMKEGICVRTYKGEGDIYDVSFNRTGELLAACFSSSRVTLLDMRM